MELVGHLIEGETYHKSQDHCPPTAAALVGGIHDQRCTSKGDPYWIKRHHAALICYRRSGCKMRATEENVAETIRREKLCVLERVLRLRKIP